MSIRGNRRGMELDKIVMDFSVCRGWCYCIESACECYEKGSTGASVAKMPCCPGEKARRGGDLLMKIVSEGN